MEGLRAREVAIGTREAKTLERETALLKMEQHTKAHKDQVEKDAQELRQQLHGARAELEDQRRYVEEKRKAAEAIAIVIEEREERLKLKEQDLTERDVIESEKGYHGGHEKLHTHQSGEVGGSAEYEYPVQMLGMRLSGTEESVNLLSILLRSACSWPLIRNLEDSLQQLFIDSRCLVSDAIRGLVISSDQSHRNCCLGGGWLETGK